MKILNLIDHSYFNFHDFCVKLYFLRTYFATEKSFKNAVLRLKSCILTLLSSSINEIRTFIKMIYKAICDMFFLFYTVLCIWSVSIASETNLSRQFSIIY